MVFAIKGPQLVIPKVRPFFRLDQSFLKHKYSEPIYADPGVWTTYW